MSTLKNIFPTSETLIALGKVVGELVSQLWVLVRSLWVVVQPGQFWRVCYEIVSFLMSLK